MNYEMLGTTRGDKNYLVAVLGDDYFKETKEGKAALSNLKVRAKARLRKKVPLAYPDEIDRELPIVYGDEKVQAYYAQLVRLLPLGLAVRANLITVLRYKLVAVRRAVSHWEAIVKAIENDETEADDLHESRELFRALKRRTYEYAARDAKYKSVVGNCFLCDVSRMQDDMPCRGCPLIALDMYGSQEAYICELGKDSPYRKLAILETYMSKAERLLLARKFLHDLRVMESIYIELHTTATSMAGADSIKQLREMEAV